MKEKVTLDTVLSFRRCQSMTHEETQKLITDISNVIKNSNICNACASSLFHRMAIRFEDVAQMQEEMIEKIQNGGMVQ